MSESDLSEKHLRSGWVVGGVWLLLVFALVVGFGGNFAEMWLRWFPAWRRVKLGLYDRIVEGESYYTHGPIIPAVSLLIVVLLIRHIRIPVRPGRWFGWVLLGLMLLLHLVATLARVNFASGFAFIGVLVALVLILWGAKAFRQLLFPIAFLVFMVPLPEVTIAQLNFRLKMFAAEWGVALANGIGVIAEHSGNRVFLEGGKDLVVANVCNGLRTLISVLAFAAVYTYVCRLRGLWRVGLFAMAIPVAVVCNAVRIVALILVAHIWNPQVAAGAFHDVSGIFIFILAFLLMFSLERLVLWTRKAIGKPATILPLFHGKLRGAPDEGQWSRMIEIPAGPRGWIAAVLVLLGAVGALWGGRAEGSPMHPDLIRQGIPASLTVDGRQFQSYDVDLNERTLTILEFPSYVNRRYVSAGVPPIDFCLIFSKDNRKGTHPPDLCLEGGGVGIIAKADIIVDDVGHSSSAPCRELIVQTSNGKQYFLYTYKCGRKYTRSFWVQQCVIFANGLLKRNSAGALIRVSTPIETDITTARQRSVAMMRTLLPHLDRNLP